MMFPFQTKSKNPGELPFFEQDLAAFMLTRGPHAFIGHSWLGCSKQYAFPEPLNKDYVSAIARVTMLLAGSALCQLRCPWLFDRVDVLPLPAGRPNRAVQGDEIWHLRARVDKGVCQDGLWHLHWNDHYEGHGRECVCELRL